MEKKKIISQFMTDLLAKKGDMDPFADDESLILSGRIDSLNILEIINWLEKEFSYDVTELMFDQNNFDSLDSIYALIAGKEGGN